MTMATMPVVVVAVAALQASMPSTKQWVSWSTPRRSGWRLSRAPSPTCTRLDADSVETGTQKQPIQEG